MTVKKVANGYRVVKSNGQLGKRTYTTKANAEKAQARGRALARPNAKNSPKKKPSGSSSSVSSPAGGARTSKSEGHGLLYRKLRTLANLTAAAWGRLAQPTHEPMDDKLADAVERYSTYHYKRGTLDYQKAIPTYEGIATSLANDWVDRKLRNSTKMSKGKLFNNLVELLPMLRARAEVGTTNHPMYMAACNWNKRTSGYDPQYGNWDYNRLEEYAVTKGLVAAYDKLVPSDWKQAANRALPEGLNLF